MNARLKDETEVISFQGRKEPITAQNLTWDKYQKLIAEFPALKEKFIEFTEETKVEKSKAKEAQA